MMRYEVRIQDENGDDTTGFVYSKTEPEIGSEITIQLENDENGMHGEATGKLAEIFWS